MVPVFSGVGIGAFRCLQVHRDATEATVVEQEPERFQTEMPLSDVIVSVERANDKLPSVVALMVFVSPGLSRSG